MKERGILFSAPMVLALLAGTKTQTRRSLKHQPPSGIGYAVRCGEYAPVAVDKHGVAQCGVEVFGAYDDDGEWGLRCPYGAPGDRLWVRECFALTGGHMPAEVADVESADGCVYRADGAASLFTGRYSDGRAALKTTTFGDVIQRWRPSIFMPRWASRITLEITDVRVQRLQDISEEDAKAEGCISNEGVAACDARTRYGELWDRINGKGAWSANPWVWCITFARVSP